MIRVHFQEPDSPEWRDWKARAAKARKGLEEARANGRKKTINADLYKERKADIFSAFNGKCAFCETLVFETDQHGDVEHFRPKGGVTDEKDRPVLVTLETGRLGPHPGYYWLAYDWTNLLPSCQLCNQPSHNGVRGKKNRFPVSDGFWAARPGEETHEKPLFLHPVRDVPEEHFVLDEVTGVLGSATPRGMACIELLALNRQGLMEKRRDMYSRVRGLIQNILGSITTAPHLAMADIQGLHAHHGGRKEYTLAARKALADARVHSPPLQALLALIEASTPSPAATSPGSP